MANKFVFPLLFGLISAFSISSIVTANGDSKQKTKVVTTPTTQRLEQNAKAAYDFSGEAEIDDGKLMVSATSSTLTDAGQSFSLTFSTGGQGYWDISETFLLAPDDEGFAEYYKEFSDTTISLSILSILAIGKITIDCIFGGFLPSIFRK